MANRNDIRRKTVGDVCRFILFSTQSKKPVQKKDLSQIIKKANVAKNSQEIIDLAKQKLLQGFGFDLIEAPNRTSYFLCVKGEKRMRGNNDGEQERQLRGKMLNYDENLRAHRGLVSVVLQLLILYGNKCEKDIFNHIMFEKIDTSIFGSPQQIIKDLKQQKWIEEEKEANNERAYYRLGPRANIETQSEWMYIGAFELVNGMRPPHNDRALQRIAQEKQVQYRHQSGRRGANYSQSSSQRSGRGRARGRGRR